MWPWLTGVLAIANLVTGALMFWAGRHGRAAAASRDEAEAIESLTTSVVQQGQRLDQVSTALWEAQQRLQLAEARAVAAEQRAATAELRSATSDAELVRLRAEVASLRAELARYESTGGTMPPATNER